MSKHLAEPTPRTIVIEHAEELLSKLTGIPGGGWGEHRASKYDHFSYHVVEAATYPVVDSLGTWHRGLVKDADGNVSKAA
jgi:hypothetical protein